MLNKISIFHYGRHDRSKIILVCPLSQSEKLCEHVNIEKEKKEKKNTYTHPNN